jgi:selenocysteine lyase/cysteine desulfurase
MSPESDPAFPTLQSGVAHFDGPGGSQTPLGVADAVREAMISPIANRGPVTAAERNADAMVYSAGRNAFEGLSRGGTETAVDSPDHRGYST